MITLFDSSALSWLVLYLALFCEPWNVQGMFSAEEHMTADQRLAHELMNLRHYDKYQMPQASITPDTTVDLHGHNISMAQFNSSQIKGLKPNDTFTAGSRDLIMVSGPLQVFVSLDLAHLIDLDDEKGILSLDVFIHAKWNDPRLNWKPDEYEGLKETYMPGEYLWQPDLVLLNSVEAAPSSHYTESDKLVSFTGTVSWTPAATFHSSCAIDFRHYPVDVQRCHVKLGSWMRNSRHLELLLLDLVAITTSTHEYDYLNEEHDNMLREFFPSNSKWQVVEIIPEKHNTQYDNHTEIFHAIVYTIRIQRTNPFYKVTILIPLLLSVTLTLSSFWLPSDSSQKVTLKALALLIQICVIFNICWRLPSGANVIPDMVMFSSYVFSVSGCAILLSIYTIRMTSRVRYDIPIPPWIRRRVDGVLGKLLCVSPSPCQKNGDGLLECGSPTDLEMPSLNKSDLTINHHVTYVDWLIIAKAVDRIFFYFFTILYVLIYVISFSG